MRLLALAALLAVAACATSHDRLRAQGVPLSSGMRVVDQAGVLPALPDATVNDVVAWWSFRYPEHAGAIRDFVARGAIIVAAQAEPIVDPWYPQVGRAYGMTRDNVCQVWWNTTLPPERAAALFDAILRHELGHIALTAAWKAFAAPRDDHAVMKSIGYPWARRTDGAGPIRGKAFAWR